MMISNLQVVGLIYDAAGISILGGPAVFRMVNEITAQSGTYWNGNPALAQALAVARIDTTAGSVLLLLGFLFQITALQGYAIPELAIDLSVPALIVLFVLYWCFLRSLFSRSLANRVELRRAQQQAERSAKTDKEV
ncbi:hypothetical protein [Candidatus Rariloculus sp.]|uniref:hypothetical protein n=1 Tax=Candidatus Rariloculus sp. TaxID=3101265 RepID=UPI003D0F69D7